MSPAFGVPESRALFPIFNRCAESVSARGIISCTLRSTCLTQWQITLKWKDLLFRSSSDAVALNLSEWLSRATLDAIAEGQKLFYLCKERAIETECGHPGQLRSITKLERWMMKTTN